MLDIAQKGKGAIPTPPEIKAAHFEILGAGPAAAPVIAWDIPYHVEDGFKVQQTDQGPTSRCVSDAVAYYGEARNRMKNNVLERFSRRHIYSQGHGPDGGMYIWRGMSIPVQQGFASMASVPDPVPMTEAGMRDTSLNGQAVIEATTDKFAVITNDRNIDVLADACARFGGFATGFNGRDDMFRPDGTARPFTGASQWGHGVWVCGYRRRSGKRELIFKNSWSEHWGDNGYGYLPEDFISAGLLFDAYVYADIKDINTKTMKRRIMLSVLEGGKGDQFTVEAGRKHLIPDLETLAFLRDEAKVVAEGDPDSVSKQEFDSLLTGRPWPSIRVDQLARSFYSGARDAFEPQ